jgi:hypothetical protein
MHASNDWHALSVSNSLFPKGKSSASKGKLLRVADDFSREPAATAKPKHLLEHLRRAPKVARNADDRP